jgi:hypothetical protein
VKKTVTAMPSDYQHAERDRIVAYADACRTRVPAFTARHFGLAGTLRLHREALGSDLLLAPLNVLLVVPALAVRIAALLCRQLGLTGVARWLARRRLFVETRLSRRMADLVLNELLGLDRASEGPPTAWREQARHMIAEYLAARHAVAEFAAALVTLCIGMILLQALTPSAISLGPLLARQLAQKEAIDAFWLGPWAGAVYHGWFPASATWPETVATTLVVMACFALAATFMGLITDPVQEWLGVHRRRLRHLVDTLERVALGDRDAVLALPDHYLARITDLADVALMALRFTR